ncbi:MAG: PTS sugar transporter subunit IIA [Magnetococcales bacterium]|nr:PTS sugar transporter subunit IIA [Magnetococcales bacterium]
MQLAQLFSEPRISPKLSGVTKEDILLEMATLIASDLSLATPQRVFDILTEREQLGTTGIGHGIAIPHGKMNGLTEPIAALGCSENGVDFKSPDGKNAYIIIALLSPQEDSKAHLQALASIARQLHRPGIRKELLNMEAPSTEALLKIITSSADSH